jgi:hypothetical protein
VKLKSVALKEEYKLGAFENRLLRTVVRPAREEATGEWRNLHNEEFHNLHSSPKLRGIMSAVHGRRDRKYWYENLQEGDHYEQGDVDETILLKWCDAV